MSIDRTTYELYIVDYLDGRLDAVVVSELLLFLEQNPDLKEELESIRNFTLDKHADAPPLDKALLKKPAYDEVKHVYEPMLIARMEGDETPAETTLLNDALQRYPALVKDETLFLQTRLQPDLTVVFKQKSRLRKFTLAPYYKPAVRIAAVLLCVSAIGLFLYKNNENTPQTANHTQQVTGGKPQAGAHQKHIQPIASNGRHNAKAKVNELPVEATQQQLAKHTHKTTRVTRGEQVTKQTQQAVVLIQPKAMSNPLQKKTVLPKPDEAGQLAYRQLTPAAIANGGPEYLDFKTWVARRLKKETSLESENTLLARINRATNADIVLEKDTTGKITRFEIAGLGFALK